MSLSSNVERRTSTVDLTRNAMPQLVAGAHAVFHHLPGSPAVARYAASVR